MEILVLLPGESRLDLENSKYDEDGITITSPEFIVPEETQNLADQVGESMKTEEEKMIENAMLGRIEAEIAPYWSH